MNKNILTYGAKVSSVEQSYYSPVVVVPPNYTSPVSSMYAFLATVDPWDDDNNPPEPTQDQKYIKQVFKNIFVTKQIQSNDISPVIERIDWYSGITYKYYRDDIDMFEKDNNGYLVNKFYIRNSYDQVFKCLWNNNDQPSTIQPYFEPGTYNTNNIFNGSDGYKWKYMYTIDSGTKLNFMDSSWIPVPVGNPPNPLLKTSGYGGIEVINITNSGSGYDAANASVSVVITGDGTGASATAQVTNGEVTDILVTNFGKNYTYANVSISSTLGANATAITATSPVGGHAFDPLSELGCCHVMYSVQFQGSEGSYIPTDVTYHQVGIVVNPTTQQTSPVIADGTIYKTSTDLIVTPGFGVYTLGEKIWQGETYETATFVGTVLDFDSSRNVICLINTKGTLILNASVYGLSSKTTRTLLNYSTPNFTLFSGHISFIQNRSAITRSYDGIEQFKIVIGY